LKSPDSFQEEPEQLARNRDLGQPIAFDPSRDLVVTRQTGSGGDWQC